MATPTLVPIPGGLVFSVTGVGTEDGAVRDDISGIKVWYSTTSGFDPTSTGILAYSGTDLFCSIENLTPGTTYYVRYAIQTIFETDTTELNISATELSASPYVKVGTYRTLSTAKPDSTTNPELSVNSLLYTTDEGKYYQCMAIGTPATWSETTMTAAMLIAGSITADKLSATAISSKSIYTSAYVDQGAVVTTSVATPSTTSTTFNLVVEDSSAIPSSGYAKIVLGDGCDYPGEVVSILYSGVTSNTLTGCYGISTPIPAGSIVLPAQDGFCEILGNYGSGSTTIQVNSILPSSGTAYVRVNDVASNISISWTGITYVSGSYNTTRFNLTGVTGLTPNIYGSAQLSIRSSIVWSPTTGTAYTNITCTGSIVPSWYPTTGGYIVLKTLQLGVIENEFIKYSSRSGNVFTLVTPKWADYSNYYIEPLFSCTAITTGSGSVYTVSNTSQELGIISLTKLGINSLLARLKVLDNLEVKGKLISKSIIASTYSSSDYIISLDQGGSLVDIGSITNGLDIKNSAGRLKLVPGASYAQYYTPSGYHLFTQDVSCSGAITTSTDVNVSGSVTGNGGGLAMHVGGSNNASSTTIYGGGSASVNEGAAVYCYGRTHATTAERGRFRVSTAAQNSSGSAINTSRMYINSGDSSSTPWEIFWYVDGAEVLRLNRSPTATLNGIITSAATYNNTTASAANMYVSSGGSFYRSTSSGKYKTDIEPVLPKYYEKVWELEPIYYRSTCSGDNKDWSYWGFLAEQVAQVDPRLVNWGYPLKKDWVDAVAAKPAVIDEYGNEVITAQPAQEGGFRFIEDTSKPMQPEGVAYERIPVLLLGALKDEREKRIKLEDRVKLLEDRLNSLLNTLDIAG